MSWKASALLQKSFKPKRYRTCMLHNVAVHNVSIRNVKVSKHERHITYSVTKRTASQKIKYTLRKRYKTFCNVIPFVTLYVCDVYVLKTLRFRTLTLCPATFCNITSCDVYIMLLYVMQQHRNSSWQKTQWKSCNCLFTGEWGELHAADGPDQPASLHWDSREMSPPLRWKQSWLALTLLGTACIRCFHPMQKVHRFLPSLSFS